MGGILLSAETAATVYDFISNVGFPIAVCGYLLYSQKAERKEHKDETDGFIQAINNNTVAITKFADKIDALEEKINAK